MMIACFAIREDCLQQVPWDLDHPPTDVLWVDLVEPTVEECQRVEKAYGAQLPALAAMEEIEATARFFEDRNGMHIHSYFPDEIHLDVEAISGAEPVEREEGQAPRLVTVAFTIQDQRLYTVRQEELSAFRMFRFRARRQVGVYTTATQIVIGLLETKVDLLADALERIYAALDATSQQVFSKPEQDMKRVLHTMSEFEDVNGKVRLVLLDTQRAFSFLQRHADLDALYRQKIKEGFRDIESLIPHTAYLFQKVNFLMDTATGMINVQQNRIIKALTLASVVFLPPTLIASIYGMNFSNMPELTAWWGYPFALAAIVLSAVIPIWFFKHKGWL